MSLFKAILDGEEEVRQWLDCGEVPWKKVDNPFFGIYTL